MQRVFSSHRSRTRHLCATLVWVLAATLAHARPAVQPLAPGEYVSAGGWGVLTLRAVPGVV